MNYDPITKLERIIPFLTIVVRDEREVITETYAYTHTRAYTQKHERTDTLD